MFEDFNFADENGFKGDCLDDYLAAGYYRMQHAIFTTHFTQMDLGKDPLPVFWLRTPVKQIKQDKKSIAIRNKCAGFKVSYQKATISEDINKLYSIYRKHINFDAGENCESYLHDNYFPNPFDSWMIEIRDENNLIAAGYFDLGKNAIAGILNFYHPDYKKYSLGKYLMLMKIDYALHNDITFYYTGYISTAISKFDYKIFPDAAAIQVFLPKVKLWIPYILLGKEGLKASLENDLIDSVSS